MYTVYAINKKENQKNYIGQTVNLKTRLEQHNQKTFEGYTSRFDGLWNLIYSEEVVSRIEAMRREKQLKSFRGREFIKRRTPGVPPVGGSAVEPG